MKSNKHIYFLLIVSICHISCKKFLDINAPKISVGSETVFKTDDLATSAALNLYSSLNSSSFATGFLNVTFAGGLSSDELVNYGDSRSEEFYENQISPTNIAFTSLYNSPYTLIFKANSILEGLRESNSLTPSVKKQLEGEAHFIRAFTYFYLVNLYGPVPLQLNSDYRIARSAPRAKIDIIYQQIIEDLHISEGLLTDQYITTERVRPNLSAVQALLARVYLFTKDWTNAEKYSSLVIAKTNIYNLVPFDNIFLKNSQEAIWQLFPIVNTNGGDGSVFILTGTPTQVSLRSEFALNAFEANDKRRTSWVRSFTNSTGTYYYPFKYKVKSATTPTEYTMVLRLAEQYLIRAEAKINNGNIEEGVKDLNIIRQRPIAGINTNLIPALSINLAKESALLAVEQERKIELFSEWGHRWLDIKRIGKATEILGSLKSKWQATDVLYPIPYDEITKNPNVEQNLGY